MTPSVPFLDPGSVTPEEASLEDGLGGHVLPYGDHRLALRLLLTVGSFSPAHERVLVVVHCLVCTMCSYVSSGRLDFQDAPSRFVRRASGLYAESGLDSCEEAGRLMTLKSVMES